MTFSWAVLLCLRCPSFSIVILCSPARPPLSFVNFSDLSPSLTATNTRSQLIRNDLNSAESQHMAILFPLYSIWGENNSKKCFCEMKRLGAETKNYLLWGKDRYVAVEPKL